MHIAVKEGRQTYHLNVPMKRSGVCRCTTKVVEGVEYRTMLDELVHNAYMTIHSRMMKWCVSFIIPHIHLVKGWRGCEGVASYLHWGKESNLGTAFLQHQADGTVSFEGSDM